MAFRIKCATKGIETDCAQADEKEADRADIEKKLEYLCQMGISPLGDDGTVEFSHLQDDTATYRLDYKSGKKRSLWILTPMQGALQVKRELSLTVVNCYLRNGFYLMALIFLFAVAVRMAMEHRVMYVMAASLLGMIPLWMIIISLVLNLVTPRKIIAIYLDRKLKEQI